MMTSEAAAMLLAVQPLLMRYGVGLRCCSVEAALSQLADLLLLLFYSSFHRFHACVKRLLICEDQVFEKFRVQLGYLIDLALNWQWQTGKLPDSQRAPWVGT
jgi:hypothetical protein